MFGLFQAIDVCAKLGLQVEIACMGGSDVLQAAIAHLSVNTPAKYLTGSSSNAEMFDGSVGKDKVKIEHGYMTAPDKPGLGIEVDTAILGDPIFIC